MRLTRRLVGVAILIATGCTSHDEFVQYEPAGPFLPYVQEIEYPDAELTFESKFDPSMTEPPPSVRNPSETEKWPLTLEETIQIALANSQVLRDLGGRVVGAPAAAATIYDPALAEADPRGGVEAALSAFDAQLSTQFFREQTDRRFNNIFFGGGVGALKNNDGTFQVGVTKTAATGTQFSAQNLTIFSDNLANTRFPTAYDTLFSVGVRQPLLQGAGTDFNRIAGPNATPGTYNGVLIARLNSDISLTDFEAAVRDLLRDIERTYWELYFAYRDLDSKRQGREFALESWQLEKRRADAGTRTPDQEAFARQQFYLAQVSVENALTGNANGGGGVYAVERQLRSLLGLPTSDGRLIVPADEPLTADVRFDWYESLALALTRRAELRRQKWQLKRRELELVAARNFRRMRLDFVGEYRWRGWGDNLIGGGAGAQRSAFTDLADGDLQEYRVGLELLTPVGNRQGHAAVRHAELQLAREAAVLEETERRISTELNGAFTELDRAYVVTRSQYNRRVATLIRLKAERERNEGGRTELDLVLDAQRQAVDAESNYWRTLVDYNLALLDLHHARGTLLDHMNVYLTEGPWTEEAHNSAAKLSRRFRYKLHDYRLDGPHVSSGAYPQGYEGNDGHPATLPEDLPLSEPVPLPDPAG